MAARILLIEDNATNMDLMVYLLTAFGYESVTARNGREGVEIATQSSCDLIICDLEMPEMNGYEVARFLRAQPPPRRVPLIAVTAFAMVGDRDKILQSGFDGYLSKPIYPELFVKQIEAFLAPEQLSGKSPVNSGQVSVAGETPPKKNGTVLVVDDSPVNLSLIHSTLGPCGYKVISAGSVKEAMAEVRRNTFDLILSDLHMPEESGVEFLRQVREDPALLSVPFLLLSASASTLTDVSEYAQELNAKVFFARPLEPGTLLAIIDNLLQEALRD